MAANNNVTIIINETKVSNFKRETILNGLIN